MKRASVVRLPEKGKKAARETPGDRPLSERSERFGGGAAPQVRRVGALAEGLVPGRIAALEEDVAVVELLGGGRVEASPADDVEPGFLAECLRARRTVLVTKAGAGVVLLGALQTASHVAASGPEVTVRTGRFVVDATEGLVLRVGQTEVALDPRGVVRFAGEKMSVAVAKVFRVLSATAELP